MFAACWLAKAGYYGGDPVAVAQAPADVIQSIVEYEAFEGEYQDAYVELNKEKK